MSKMRTKKEADSLHEKAIALVENRNVWFENHTVRWIPVDDDVISCEVCEMDCLCRMAMTDLCAECSSIARTDGYLQLVTQD